MWNFARKKEFRMSEFDKDFEFKKVFYEELGCEDYKTTKPILYQTIRKTKKKGKKKNAKN